MFVVCLFKDKGVCEFVEVIKILWVRGVLVFFWLVGDIDLINFIFLLDDEINEWQKEGFLEVFGYQKDIVLIFVCLNFVVLFLYREGLLKVLIEVVVCGCVVVIIDVLGCCDVIDLGWIGFFVFVWDGFVLVDVI